MSETRDERAWRDMQRVAQEVWGNVCRCCNRDIKGKLEVSDRDAEDFPRCSECVPPVKLEAFGCYVWLWDGVLFELHISDFEEYGKNYDLAVEVTAPASQLFLDAVNEAFGSTFRLDQFSGR